MGIDIRVYPGQRIYAPFDCYVKRAVRQVYSTNNLGLKGAVLVPSSGERYEVKILYCELMEGMVGRDLKEGRPFAVAQDIRKRYTNRMQPHIHLTVRETGPQVPSGKGYVDPTLMLDRVDQPR
jgi:hypothetical protein